MLFLKTVGWFEQGFRLLWSVLCQLIYPLIAGMFNLFVNISKVEVLSSDDIKPIYQRVTLILAIIMVFYVTFELVKYIIEPDSVSDKEKGAGNIIKKLIVVVLLIAFVPNIFQVAYKFQNIVIEKQILSKMIIGSVDVDAENFGGEFSANLFKMFYYYDKAFWNGEEKNCDKAKCSAVVASNLYQLSSESKMDNLNYGLNEAETHSVISGSSSYSADVALITYNGLLAVLVGAFVVYILLLYCVDIGARVIQLVFLQIIAPIPIIGYLSPKKDNIFNKWLKQCTTTYIDLFIRLAIIYFIFLICDILTTAYTNGNLFKNIPDNANKGFIYIFLILGLLLFAQRAPKMLQELFPKMGAASSTFGLKASERVAPAAARAIGAGLGGTSRLLGGAITRGINTHRRNKDIKERTGKTSRERREEAKLARTEFKNQRRAYKNAKRSGDQEAIKAAKDKKIEAESKYAEAMSNKNRSTLLNAASGAAMGAVRGTKTGFGATKLEEIGKKGWTEAANVDKKAIDSREQWLNAGGYSNVRRAVSSVEQKMGITTHAGRTERDIKKIDDDIKHNKSYGALEAASSETQGQVEKRLSSKIDAGELKNSVLRKTIGGDNHYIEGVKDRLDIRDDDTVSTLTGRYQAKADAAKSQLDNLIKNEASEAEISAAEEASSKATALAQAVRKHSMRNAFTQILQNPTSTKNDPVAMEILETMKTNMINAKRNKETIERFNDRIEKDFEDRKNAILSNPDLTDAEKANQIASAEANKLDYEKHFRELDFEHFTWDIMDGINTALKNVKSDRDRENMQFEETKRAIEASDAYAAQKADDSSTKSGK